MKIKNKGYFSFSHCSYIPDSDTIVRDCAKSGFEIRLCSSVDDCYTSGGVCLMLTFTYNNENLPYILNPLTMEKVPCFDRGHIRKFLNQLKIRVYRHCRGAYKYFICMEYGKNTKRQHYHGLFMLDSSISVKFFVDTCRELWRYGFMFPAPYGNPYEAAKLRSRSGGASYAAKYVCKDISYYSIPSVVRLMDWFQKQKRLGNDLECDYIREYLPRIYQSNGIGASLLNQLSSNFEKTVNSGVLNPLTKKYCPIPSYILNKYFYRQVLAFDGRLGSRGKPLYDRILNCDIQDLLLYNRIKLSRLSMKYRNELSGSCYIKYRNSIDSKLGFHVDDMMLSNMLSVYRYSRCYSSNMLDYVKDISGFFDISIYEKFLALQTDTYSRYVENSKRSLSSPLVNYFYDVYSDSLFSDLDKLLKLIDDKLLIDCEERIKENERLYELKRVATPMIYPVNLC